LWEGGKGREGDERQGGKEERVKAVCQRKNGAKQQPAAALGGQKLRAAAAREYVSGLSDFQVVFALEHR